MSYPAKRGQPRFVSGEQVRVAATMGRVSTSHLFRISVSLCVSVGAALRSSPLWPASYRAGPGLVDGAGLWGPV
jgi:hypothetical protein